MRWLWDKSFQHWRKSSDESSGAAIWKKKSKQTFDDDDESIYDDIETRIVVVFTNK